MNRTRRRLAIAGVGAGVSLLMGSGLFALTSDSIRSSGNSGQSGTYAVAPTTHDLKWARVLNPADCQPGGASYADGPMTALISSGGTANIDLQRGTGASSADILCLKNAGSQAGRVVATFAATDVEVGTCQATESAAGDTSCADLAAGELRPVLTVRFTADPSSTATCDAATTATSFSVWEGAGRSISSQMDPGEFCVYQFDLGVLSTATDTQKLVAQTDKVQFDVTFTLSDTV